MLKVIGAGFGRTGTMSTQAALEQLGFGRCYHFREMLKSRHTAHWLRIAAGERPQWETLFTGYQATTDWPGVAYYRELAAAYPAAKVILTVRDSNTWYQSVHSTIYRLRAVLPVWVPGINAVARLTDKLIWHGIFQGNFKDRAYAIAKFETHNAEVRKVIQAERLLVFDVRDGWVPLCEFLRVPVPTNIPFPQVNEAQAVHRLIRLIKTAKYAPALLVLCALGYFAVRNFR